MRIKILVNDTDMSSDVQATSLEITQNISDRVSQAKMEFIIHGGADVAKYDEATYDNAVYGVDVQPLYEIRIEDRDTGVKQFAGTIRQVKPDRKKAGLRFLAVECLDWTTLLDEAYVVSATFTGQTDRAIIQALVGTYAPALTALTVNIASTATLTWEVKEKTLRQALDELAEYTGAEWKVDYDKNLKYFLPSTYPAPFGFSSEPNNTTTFGISDRTEITRDAIRLINRCTVLGAVMPGGVRLKQVYDDPVSQMSYGVRPLTIVDDQITVAVVAMLRAQSVVQENAYPKETISIPTILDGLEAGQAIPLFHSDYSISGTYIIREVTLRQRSRTKTEYSLKIGAREPDTLRLLRQLDARTRRNTASPIAVPADGTVTNSSIGGLINTSNLIGTITSTGNVSVNANSVFGTLTGTNITVDAAVVAGTFTAANGIIVNANTIQGLITGVNVAVDVTTFQGAIISSQVADGLIDRLSLLSEPLRWIPNLASDPSLPDANYPAGSFYRRTSDNQFRENVAGSWANATESEAISGKLAFHSIGTIKAGSIIGLIAAGQIDTITAAQISGAIIASQISSVNASAITGTVTAAQIATVNASSIQGSIAASQIGSVNASAITGTITAGQISSVNASAITGTITSGQIASVSAGSITGTITSGQIGSINAATITIGLVGDSQISGLSAGKITAGTISATVTMTSPVLVIASGAVTVNIDATNKIKITDTGFFSFAQMLGTQFRLESTSNNFVFSQIVTGGFQVQDSAFNRCDVSTTGVSFQSIRVLGARRTGWTTSTGTVRRTGWDTSTVSLVQLAETVKALIDDLHSNSGHGMIGS